jgi:glycerol-3-phosphate dehydrogenase
LKPIGDPWTAGAPLPGGDVGVRGLPREIASLRALCPACTRRQAERLVRAYGTQARRIVEGVRCAADWGVRFGADLTEREVRYLMQNEFAQSGEDILWRRSKLGLRLSAAEAAALDAWMRAPGVAAGRAPSLAR